MKAIHIASVPATTTFVNATSTTFHFFQVGDKVYRAESNCRETFPDITPIKKIVECQPKDVILSGELNSRLEAGQ